jgi:signal transduction histidine kinase
VSAISPPELLDAAAWGLVGERCRPSYLHDLRGSLQVFHSAVELLFRAANGPGGNTALAEKASALARRAIESHETLLAEVFNQITPQQEAPVSVDVGAMVGDVLRFLRGEIARKSITFQLQSVENVLVLAQQHKFRLIILGLASSLADALAAGSLVEIAVTRLDSNAVVEFKSNMPRPSILQPEQLWSSAGATISSYELLLSVAQRWLSVNRGFLELPAPGQLPGALRICYPCARR